MSRENIEVMRAFMGSPNAGDWDSIVRRWVTQPAMRDRR